jgi:adenylate cyclase, class 2
MVRPERLELPAYWFEASRSIQLSYGRTHRSLYKLGYTDEEMARAASNLETEIKLPLDSAAATRRQLRKLGFSIVKRRVFESNTIFDTPAGELRTGRKLLRLRQAGRRHTLTYKGSPVVSRYKSREELESEFDDPSAMRRILGRLGYTPVFRYEKYRTEFAAPDATGAVMLDETPIGPFLELEGPPRWINRTARALGFSPASYITASYGKLYLEHCRSKGVKPTNMVFDRSGRMRLSPPKSL